MQEAETPRLKRIIVLLHKIGESLHAAQTHDHPKNTAGAKLVTSFLTKLAISVRPASPPGNNVEPAAPHQSPDSLPADSAMSEPGGEEEEEVRLHPAVHLCMRSLIEPSQQSNAELLSNASSWNVNCWKCHLQQYHPKST